MSKCLNCIHKTVCANSEIEPIECMHFLNKNDFDLPIVGEMIYIISDNVLVEQKIKRIESDSCLAITDFYSLSFDDFGKTVFLSENKAREKMRSNKQCMN